jgi:hypothetical protein
MVAGYDGALNKVDLWDTAVWWSRDDKAVRVVMRRKRTRRKFVVAKSVADGEELENSWGEVKLRRGTGTMSQRNEVCGPRLLEEARRTGLVESDDRRFRARWKD